MPFGTTKRVVRKCGLHVSPKYVIENKDKLARVNVASVSLVSGKPVDALTRWWCDKETARPFSAFVVDTGSQVQDSLWLIWKLPDEVWQQINPDFFKDDKGNEWHPQLP